MTDTPPADWTEGRCPASVLYDDGMCGKRAAIGNLCRFHHVIATHRALITSARIGGR
ncbi:hypothetical protein OS128_05290 [Corynebacterium sp. P5848]|uniref:hypothetical protein n=1 Tax=Corynebacterium marambiense TaxID=2765364 RepID=UPI002260B480|nr:hypothetical protein [Corynebacterium marambiense]MCX7542325.1 hypothetical protein [Corynebacterium marambiense]